MDSTKTVALVWLFLLAIQGELPAQLPPDLAQQIAKVMAQAPNGRVQPRFIHAKGVVCKGTFEAAPTAASISRAAYLASGGVPVTVRFSDGVPDIAVLNNSADAAPRGMVIRFVSGRGTDVTAISHNGFVVGTGPDEAAGKAMSPNFPSEELRTRLAKAPASFRLLLQLADPGNQTHDTSVVWPDKHKKVELGIITITSIVPDSAVAERDLAFDHARLVDGIELSDDPLPALRSRVYIFGRGRRRKQSHGS